MKRTGLLIAGMLASTAVALGPGEGLTSSDTSAKPPVSAAVAGGRSVRSQTSGDMSHLFSQFHGVAKPSQLAQLPPLAPGMIQKVHVAEGQFVRKGDALVSLDDRVPRARLLSATIQAGLTGALKRAEVDLRMAESRLTRIRSALAEGAGAQFELEAAEGSRDQARAAVDQQRDILKAAEAERQLAEAQLSQFTIAAPFDGIVTEIHVKSGAIDPSQVAVTVANLNQLEVELHLPSSMIGSVRSGQTLRLNAQAPVARDLEAAVISVSPIINSTSDTFRCLLRIPNTRTKLPAGFSVVLSDSSAAAADSVALQPKSRD